MSMKEAHLTTDDGYDSGILQKRLYFEKINIADSITVTLQSLEIQLNICCIGVLAIGEP